MSTHLWCDPGFESSKLNNLFLCFCIVSSLSTLAWIVCTNITSGLAILSGINLLLLTTWQLICYNSHDHQQYSYHSCQFSLLVKSVIFTLLLQSFISIFAVSAVWLVPKGQSHYLSGLIVLGFICIRLAHVIYTMKI